MNYWNIKGWNEYQKRNNWLIVEIFLSIGFSLLYAWIYPQIKYRTGYYDKIIVDKGKKKHNHLLEGYRTNKEYDLIKNDLNQNNEDLDLRIKEINQLRKDIDKSSQTISKLTTSISSLSDEIKRKDGEIKSRIKELTDYKTKYEDKYKYVDDLEEDIDDFVKYIDSRRLEDSYRLNDRNKNRIKDDLSIFIKSLEEQDFIDEFYDIYKSHLSQKPIDESNLVREYIHDQILQKRPPENESYAFINNGIDYYNYYRNGKYYMKAKKYINSNLSLDNIVDDIATKNTVFYHGDYLTFRNTEIESYYNEIRDNEDLLNEYLRLRKAVEHNKSINKTEMYSLMDEKLFITSKPDKSNGYYYNFTKKGKLLSKILKFQILYNHPDLIDE